MPVMDCSFYCPIESIKFHFHLTKTSITRLIVPSIGYQRQKFLLPITIQKSLSVIAKDAFHCLINSIRQLINTNSAAQLTWILILCNNLSISAELSLGVKRYSLKTFFGYSSLW